MGRSTRDTELEPLAAWNEEMEHIMEGVHLSSYDLSVRSPWSGSRSLISYKFVTWNDGLAMNVSHFCVLFYFKEYMVWILEEKIFLFPSSYQSRCIGIPNFLSWLLLFLLIYNYFCCRLSCLQRVFLASIFDTVSCFYDTFLFPSVFSHMKSATVSKVVMFLFDMKTNLLVHQVLNTTGYERC